MRGTPILITVPLHQNSILSIEGCVTSDTGSRNLSYQHFLTAFCALKGVQPFILPDGEDAADVLGAGNGLAIELREVGQRRQPEPVTIVTCRSVKLLVVQLISRTHLNLVFFSFSGNFSSS